MYSPGSPRRIGRSYVNSSSGSSTQVIEAYRLAITWPGWRRSTSPFERVNKEINRRSRVVGIFANDAAVIRLVGAILTDMHDEWQSGERRYCPRVDGPTEIDQRY